MFIRAKTVKGNKYFYLIENERVEGKAHPVQRTLAYLGNQEAALAALAAASYPDTERLIARVQELSTGAKASVECCQQTPVESDEVIHDPKAVPQKGHSESTQTEQTLKEPSNLAPMPSAWQELNDRQRQYLEVIYRADTEAEAAEAASWKRGWKRRPADVWRWLPYNLTNLGSPTPLKRRLLRCNLVDQGTGSTFDALARRGLILYEEGDGLMARIRLTTQGRKIARIGLGESAPKKLPTGTLREWHWRALSALYADMLAAGIGFPETNRVAGWNTWLRLLEYKPEPLAEERKHYLNLPSMGRTSTYHLYITEFGRSYYEQNWQRYRELYPEVEAPAPTSLNTQSR